MTPGSFIEIDHYQRFKDKQHVGGDSFLSRKLKDENRIISVLSDGLGSGIKANVLSTLTATMALNYISNSFDIKKAAQVIMRTLPVCKERKISYSTFTIVDINEHGRARIIEYDNPSYILIRNGEIINFPKQNIELENVGEKKAVLHFSEFDIEMGDRIVLFSDGVSQSGIGSKKYPLGWGEEEVGNFVKSELYDNPKMSARELAQSVVSRALTNNQYKALDDITCGVVNIREPRKLLVVSGPPIDKNKDKELAEAVQNFTGCKVICGGTTAKIISRELDESISVDLKHFDKEVPPISFMNGIDLITEGTITLGKVVELLESEKDIEDLPGNGAGKIVNIILNSDIIEFIVGTKINDAHQDPNIPVELEIRRNIFKRIVQIIESKHLKSTSLKFI